MLFFQLINARHERASTVLTSNKGFEEWGHVAGPRCRQHQELERPLGGDRGLGGSHAPDCPSSAKVSGPRRHMGAEGDAAGGSSISAWTGPV